LLPGPAIRKAHPPITKVTGNPSGQWPVISGQKIRFLWTGHLFPHLISCPMPPTASAPEIVHEQGLHHQLTAGQMTMVAVGGSIGPGLLLGSAAALEVAGPSIILSYVIPAFLAYTVAMALGEL